LIIFDFDPSIEYVPFMARPLRIEYEGAYYHVLSRGNKQQAIFFSDDDRNTFLKTFERMSERFEADIIAFVLMDNTITCCFEPTDRTFQSPCSGWVPPTP